MKETDAMKKMKVMNTAFGMTIADYNSNKECEKFMDGMFSQPLTEIGTYLKRLADEMVKEMPDEIKSMTCYEFLEIVYSNDEDEELEDDE